MKFIYLLIIYTILLMFCIASHGKEPTYKQVQTIVNVARKYDINANKLLQIAFIESTFRERVIRVNKNKTIDVGMFQINSIHFDTICKDLNVFSLNGNAECAARLILKHKKHETNDNQWLARYHSKTPSLKEKYYEKILNSPDFTKVLLVQADK